MNAIGMCRHNNLSNYCPSCVKETKMRGSRTIQGLGRLGSYSDFAGMGADCPEGYYDLKIFGASTGQCVPSLGTLTEGAKEGATGTLATGAAQSSGTRAALESAAANSIGTKIVGFYKNSPVVAWSVTAGIIALVIYGGMSFARGR